MGLSKKLSKLLKNMETRFGQGAVESRVQRNSRQSALEERYRGAIRVHGRRVEEPVDLRVGFVDHPRPALCARALLRVDGHGCASSSWPASCQIQELEWGIEGE